MTTGGDDIQDNKNIAGDEVRGDKVEGNKVQVEAISDVKEGGTINVAGGSIFQRIINVFSGLSDWALERFRKQQLIGFIIVGVLIIGSALALYLGLKPHQPSKMEGNFCIAVAALTEVGDSGNKQPGVEIAKQILYILNANLDEILGSVKPRPKIVIWGPDQVDSIRGKNSQERALMAEKLAEEIDAHMVIYGVITSTLPVWKVSPEFYIRDKNFYDAQEITGQSSFGTAINIPEDSNFMWPNITPLYIRSQALSRLAFGLAYYATRQYPDALKMFQSAETIPGWEDDQGKEVLYLLMGNTVSRMYQEPLMQSSDAVPDLDQLDQAEAYYQRSREINPEYSRAYIGLGSMAYQRALLPFQRSKQYKDINSGWLETGIKLNQQALAAGVQPPLAEIPNKVHLNLGSDYMMQVLAGVSQLFDPAMAEFQAVIDEYNSRQDDNDRRRIKELASEAHARLALIYDLSNHPEEAIREYQAAIDLSDVGYRREQYQKRITDITARSNGETP